MTIENESLMLKLQQVREEESHKQEANSKKVTFNPVPRTVQGMETHRKKSHPTYKPYLNMEACSYGVKCHFSHEPQKKAYRCYQCGEEFNTRSDMMVYRKNYHELEDCREFLKNAKCRYNENCWWAHPFEGEGFWDAPQTQTPPIRENSQIKQALPGKSVEKNHKKRGPHATNDDCDDPVPELAEEPVKNTDANCHESVQEPLNESVTTKNWLPKNQCNRNKKENKKTAN